MNDRTLGLQPGRLLLTNALAFFAALATMSTAAAPPPDPQELTRYVETAMHDWQVPGIAIAVVKDDSVVLARGFGVRKFGADGAVTPDTLFPIASLTKGFTATLAAVEVASGRVTWDRRVGEMLPGFSVADPWVTRELRLDDLLTHRTGWPEKIDLLWQLGLDHDAILARTPEFQQGTGFRSEYTYLNVPYVIAGEALAHGTGMQYTALLRDRVLAPLGMNATRVSMAEARTVADRISAHSDFDGVVKPIELADGDAVAPAAALHSTAKDMARWLRFHLGDGSLDGKRLLTEGQLAQLHEPQVIIPRSAFFRRLYPSSHFQSYARGWVVQDYAGRAVVWNTGGLYGAACSIALVPEEKLGVVVLTNAPRTSLPDALVFRVIDAWLGNPPRDWAGERLEISRAARARFAAATREQVARTDANAKAQLPFEGYAGKYRMPLLGELEVSARDSGLRVVLGKLTGNAAHWRNDAFLVTWDDPFAGTNIITFALDAEARPVRLNVEEIGDFERMPPAAER